MLILLIKQFKCNLIAFLMWMTTGFTQAFNIDINRFNMILRQHLFRELRCEFMYAGYFAAGCAVQVRMLVGVVE